MQKIMSWSVPLSWRSDNVVWYTDKLYILPHSVAPSTYQYQQCVIFGWPKWHLFSGNSISKIDKNHASKDLYLEYGFSWIDTNKKCKFASKYLYRRRRYLIKYKHDVNMDLDIMYNLTNGYLGKTTTWIHKKPLHLELYWLRLKTAQICKTPRFFFWKITGSKNYTQVRPQVYLQVSTQKQVQFFRLVIFHEFCTLPG